MICCMTTTSCIHNIYCVCRYAGIGGLSEKLGWTEVQQESSPGFAGGVNTIFAGVAFILLLDGLAYAYEYIQFLRGTPLGQ